MTTELPTYIGQTALGRRLGLSHETMMSRIRDRGIEPDGLLIHPCKGPGMIFNTERLSELRKAIVGPAAQS